MVWHGMSNKAGRSQLPFSVSEVRPISVLGLSLLRFVDSSFSRKSPLDMTISPLTIKILLKASPPKSRILVRRLAVPEPRCHEPRVLRLFETAGASWANSESQPASQTPRRRERAKVCKHNILQYIMV